MKKDENNCYSIKIGTTKEKIEFKFTLGSWGRVECNTGGKDVPNRIAYTIGPDTLNVSISAWKDEKVVSTKQSNVHVISENFYMPEFNRYRRIWIYLPLDYEQTKKHYPVVYMHDAQNLFDNLTSFSGA